MNPHLKNTVRSLRYECYENIKIGDVNFGIGLASGLQDVTES
jgi:hypothetical protein